MKSIDELLIAWRDETITAAELKELERLLAEPGARERLFEEFLTTATIAEALKVETSAPAIRRVSQPRKSWWIAPRLLLGAAAAVLLLIAGAIYLNSQSQPQPQAQASAPREFQIVAGSALVDQKKDGPISENSVVACEGNDSATIRFPDGSTMDLAPSSSTVLHRRSVELKAGKASFEIQKVQQAADAFSVKTEVGSVTVVGTKFSVELQPQRQNTQGGTKVKRAALILAVSVLAGSVRVDYDGSHYVLAMGQSQAFGEDKDTPPALPEALKGFSGTMNGEVVKVGKDSIVLKLHPGNVQFQKLGVGGKEVTINIKDVQNPPELQANDGVYATVSEANGQLNATKLIKTKSSK